MKELVRALAVLAEPPAAETARVASALDLPPPSAWQYDDLFVQQLYPYAAVYLGGEGKLGGDARDRAAGVWRALGAAPPDEPDHLASLLGLYARLLEAEAANEAPGAASWAGVRRGVLHEHLLSWMPIWLARADELGARPYRAWAELLGRWLREEAAGAPPRELPASLREAPPLGSPEAAGGADFVERLLAPARTGLVLARDDLARAAAALGLGLRVGERRWVLRALLAQDAAGTLEWLAAEGVRQSEKLGGWPGPLAAFWRERAATTAATLRRAAAVAAEAVP